MSGNELVDGAGDRVRLLGVDASSTEYACVDGYAYSSEPLTPADARAIAGWHADAVRVPLNEDCWLGINGMPAYGNAAGYRAAIARWVADLHRAGPYVILDLHWSAPGGLVAVGMQTLVSAIRSTGARQPILLGALSYANDLRGWLAHEPDDPDHQLVASFHNYLGEACDTSACWNATVAPVAAVVPVVTGEMGAGYDCAAGGADQYSLISSYAGTPLGPDGVTLHTQLATLAAAPPG